MDNQTDNKLLKSQAPQGYDCKENTLLAMLFHEKVLIIRINVLPSSAQVPARVVVHPNYEVRGLKSLNFQRTIGGLRKIRGF